MLSAFKAQPIHELKQRDRSKIESLLAYGDRLLVGLNTGALRIYRVVESSQQDELVENGEPAPQSPSKKKAIELLREEEKFSRKPIQLLAIIKEANLLVSLSDGYVSLHDLQEYTLVERLERTKGASCFTVTSNVVIANETSPPELVSRLAVAVKRKLLCWTWQYMEQSPDVFELSMEATVKSLNWVSGTRLVAGMDPGFSIVDVETQGVIPINKPASRSTGDMGTTELGGARFGAVSSSGMGYMGMGSWVPKPMATGLTNDQVLLAKDVNSLFADVDGKALEKRQVPWAMAPESIGYSYPYLLALQPPERGTLQIRNPDTLSLLQTIAVPSATVLHVPQPNISLAHAGKGFIVASERTIWRMNALPYDAQLSELVERERFDEAISLLSLLEDTLIDDKDGRIREIKIEKATALFHDRKYQPSLDLFTEAEAPPERVIKMYPRSIAGDLSEVPESVQNGDVEQIPDSSDAGGTDSLVKEPLSTPQKSFVSRMTGSHARKTSDVDSIKSGPSDSPNQTLRKRPTSQYVEPVEPDKALEGEDLRQAVRSLISFLAQARIRVSKHLDPDGTLKENPPLSNSETGRPELSNLLPDSVFESDIQDIDWQSELLTVATLVYTTLFRAYMLNSPTLAGSLFRIDNFCDPEVVQASLYETQRYSDLIDFLHGKKLHRQALEMLQKFGKGAADGEVPEGMEGPGRTISYLQQLPTEQIDLILEFAAWPVRQKPEVGMQVFLADTRSAEELTKEKSLVEKVLAFLHDIDVKLEGQYLEHIIDECGNQVPEFHQRLLDLYITELKSGEPEQQQDSSKSKLEALLRKSRQYNKTKTLRDLPSDDSQLFESRAIVLSALGHHKEALSIYVYQMHDYDKAEAYCNQAYQTEVVEQQACLLDGSVTHDRPKMKRSTTEVSKDKPNVFAILLGLYLRPPSGEEKRWPQALDLLSRHGARLPASRVLDLMPDELAVQELQDYFRGRLRHATSLMRQEKIMRSLEVVRKSNAEYTLLLGTNADVERGKPVGRNRRVKISEEDHCRVCHRRFGASAVRVYPDNVVVHYGCIGKKPQEGGAKVSSRGWG